MPLRSSSNSPPKPPMPERTAVCHGSGNMSLHQLYSLVARCYVNTGFLVAFRKTFHYLIQSFHRSQAAGCYEYAVPSILLFNCLFYF